MSDQPPSKKDKNHGTVSLLKEKKIFRFDLKFHF